MSTVNLGQYAQWYNFATSEQMMELTGMDPYDEDVQDVLNSYGLNYVGWAVAKDEYFDTLMDNGLEYCLVAQDPETENIDLYEWVGERLYPAIDDIQMVDFDDYEDDNLYESMSVKSALKEALNEALIDYDEVEFMDDMELEEFLQDNLNDAEQEVLSELGMLLEPSGSGAVGSFFLMDEETGQELAEIDFQDYNDKELELSTECDDINQYKEKYKAWVKKVTRRTKESINESISINEAQYRMKFDVEVPDTEEARNDVEEFAYGVEWEIENTKSADEMVLIDSDVSHINNDESLNESTLGDIQQKVAVWDWYKDHYEDYQIQDFIEFIQDEVDVPPDKFAKIIIAGLSPIERARILEFE